ncbi:Thioredoxin family protein [Histomonas meleagridis]|uniref:Thioredoxin family protein n=1 Tax=Histomonas meleagridis TaxID=135588 RepID=UPI0035597380|nr:Thioredoxin family protein [Histomonas meleagridis]KAH0796326.1 Thioredoxin family protein [Histomonas meleagridis]
MDFTDFAIKKFKRQIKFFRSNEENGKEYNCLIFPCFIAFANGKKTSGYYELPKPTSFAQWVETTLTPGYVKIKTLESLRQIMEGFAPAVIGVDIDEKPEDLPKELSFYSVNSDLFSNFNITVEKGYYFYRTCDHELVPVQDMADIKKANESIYDMVSISMLNTTFFGGYYIGFVNETSSQLELQILKKIAPQFPDVAFSIFYGKYAHKHIQSADLSNLEAPFFFVLSREDTDGGRWIIYNTSKIHDEQYISEFVNGIVNGTEPYSIISEPIENDSDVEFKKVVALNFHERVINNTNDVLITFTAPWCHHCQHFKPILNEAAKLASGTNVKIYWIDATSNDLPEEVPSIDGYPTSFFWPGNDKKNPIPYDGARTVTSIFEFIKKHSSSPFEIPEFDEKEIKSKIKMQQEANENGE